MNTNQNKWIEETPDYWVHRDSKWVVRDFLTDNETEAGWVILDNNKMMVSCEWKETKEECMEEVEFILAQEKKYGHFTLSA